MQIRCSSTSILISFRCGNRFISLNSLRRTCQMVRPRSFRRICQLVGVWSPRRTLKKIRCHWKSRILKRFKRLKNLLSLIIIAKRGTRLIKIWQSFWMFRNGFHLKNCLSACWDLINRLEGTFMKGSLLLFWCQSIHTFKSTLEVKISPVNI